MFTRLTHAAIAFALTVGVYQLYVLMAVPILEPALAEEKHRDVDDVQPAAGRSRSE